MINTPIIKSLIMLLITCFIATNASGQVCTEPISYHLESSQNGTWNSSSTWGGAGAPNSSNKNILITHKVTYGSDLKPASGTTIVVKNGGELVLDQMQTDNGAVTIILDGGDLTVKQNLQFKNSGDRICATNACITIGENLEFAKNMQASFIYSGLKVAKGNLVGKGTLTVSGNDHRVWVGGNFDASTSNWPQSGVDAWYVKGSNPSGWTGESPSSMDPCDITPPYDEIEECPEYWYGITGNELYKIDSDTFENIGSPISVINNNNHALAWGTEGVLYYIYSSSSESSIYQYNPSTGTNTSTGISLPLPSNGESYISGTADSEGNIYFIQGSGSVLIKVNPTDGTQTVLWNTAPINFGGSGVDLGIDKDDNLYIVGNNNGQVWSVPTNTTTPMLQGTIGYSGQSNLAGISDIWFDNDNQMYVSVSSGGPGIYKVDSSTWMATKVGPDFIYHDVASIICTDDEPFPNYCVTDCNDNAYLNSHDPNTIDYDNMVSTFHTTIAKEENGVFKIWGESGKPTGYNNGQDNPPGTHPALTPTEIIPANGYDYEGDILFATSGSYSAPVGDSNYRNSGTTRTGHAILTTDGLYVWGGQNVIVSSSLTTNLGSFTWESGPPYNYANDTRRSEFQKIKPVDGNPTGLPKNVEPCDVKMLFGTYQTLVIVTHDGAAYVLSVGSGLTGTGVSTASPTKWTRVQTSADNPLENVVAVRGTPNALIALTSDSKVYTWGKEVYLANGSTATNKYYATEVNLPAGVTPKMIGMTQDLSNQSYYLLATDGSLYAMGYNSKRQLGDFTTTTRTNWVRPKKSTNPDVYFDDVAWISPNEHDNAIYPGINILTKNATQYAWGENSNYMLGGSSTGAMNPQIPNGLTENDFILAVETGGHTTINVKLCEQKFGYVGHRIFGSMGNGDAGNANRSSYTYNTGYLDLCTPDLAPYVSDDLRVCEGFTADLADSHIGAIPEHYDLKWYTSTDRSPGTEVTNPDTATPGTYYAFYEVKPNAPACPQSGYSTVTVEHYPAGHPECTPVDYCTTGCNPNTFINADDPNTLEYDNIVSLYHSTIVKDDSGVFRVWGASAAADGVHHIANGQTWSGMPASLDDNMGPAIISPENGYNYKGIPLKATGGSSTGYKAEFALLTTDGLYYWGQQGSSGYLIDKDVKLQPGTGFSKSKPLATHGVSGTNPKGLPMNVAPEEVKMLFGSFRALGLVTCSGDVYMLTQSSNKGGHGAVDSDGTTWYKVKTDDGKDLSRIVALRGSARGFMALTNAGEIYTWGRDTYLGDGSDKEHRAAATKMRKPIMNAGERIKMIGMTGGNAYYVLSSDGYVYSLGTNADRELGDLTTTERKEWVQVKKPNGDFLDNIVWISPNEHSASEDPAGHAAINALTYDGKIWAWGSNHFQMLGIETDVNDPDRHYRSFDPTFMPGLDPDDEILAVATGGHISMTIKLCTSHYGYVGHRIFGSMADGTNGDEREDTYNFEDTIELNLCGAVTIPNVNNLKICEGETVDNLQDLLLGNPPANFHAKWFYDTALQDEITDLTNVGVGTYYVAYFADPGFEILQCDPVPYATVKISNLKEGDPGYEDCIFPINAKDDYTQTNQNTRVSGNVLDNDDDVTKVVSVLLPGDTTPTDVTPGGLTDQPIMDGGAEIGKLDINPDGSYTFTPAEDYTGDVPAITYTGSNDDETVFDSADLHIKVHPVYDPLDNNPPVAYDDTVYTEKGEEVEGDVLANDTDPDGDDLTVTHVVVPGEHGPVEVEVPVNGDDTDPIPVYNEDGTEKVGELVIDKDGKFTFTPEDDFVGEVPPIEYTIDDGNGGTDTADLNVVVTEDPIDEMTDIIANDDLNSAPQGVPMEGDVSENDLWTGDNPKITKAVATVNGEETTLVIGVETEIKDEDNKVVVTITLNEDGTYDYTPEPDFVGNVDVDYTVKNNEDSEDSATLRLTSTPIKPVAMDDINQTQQGLDVSGNVLDNDYAHNEPLTVDSAEYMDSSGNFVTLPINTTTDVYGYDDNGAVVPAGKLTLNPDGSYTFEPNDEFTGTVPVEYTAKDDLGYTDDAELSIKVIPTFDPTKNNPPVAQDDVVITDKDTPVEGDLLANDSDPDGDEIKVTEVVILDNSGTPQTHDVTSTDQTIPVHDENGDKIGDLTINEEGEFTFTPKDGFVGEVPPIEYTIEDEDGASDTADLKVSVVNKDVIGEIRTVDDSQVAPKGVAMEGDVSENDDWGDDAKNPKITEAVVTVNGEPVSFDLTNPNPQDLVVGGVVQGTLELDPTNGKYTFTPAPEFTGNVNVVYTVTNDDGAEDTSTLYLTTLDVDGPTAKDDIVQTPQNTAVDGNVLTNDDGDEIKVTDFTYLDENGNEKPGSLNTSTTIYDNEGNKAGTIIIDEDGNYTFTPETGYTGKVPVDYTIEDKHGQTDEAHLEIHVIPSAYPSKNNPPVATNDNVTTKKNLDLDGNVLSNDSDPDGDDIKVTGAEQNGTNIPVGVATVVSGKDENGNSVANAGKITLNPDGSFTFEPADDFVGTINPIDYTIKDYDENNLEKGGEDTASLNITVEDKDASENLTYANDDANSAPKGETMTGNVLDNDFDPEGDTQTLTSISIDGVTTEVTSTDTEVVITDKGTLTISPNGDYTFVPEADFVGTLVVEQSVCDDGTPVACDKATLYLTSLGIRASRLFSNPHIIQRTR